MRNPNQRYGHPAELLYYMRGMSAKDLAKTLHRSEKTIKNYLSGREKIPFWIPELLRLKEMEYWQRHYRAGIDTERLKLGVVKGNVIEIATRKKRTSNSAL